MTWEIDVNGRTRVVSVGTQPAGGGDALRLSIDGVPYAVSAVRTGLGFSLLYDDGRGVDAAVTASGSGQWLVQLPNVTLTAIVDGRRHRRASAGRTAAPGEQHVTAPMPGRVLRVLVRPGDQVAERQGLVVIEAMKMENELTAPRAGRVKDVTVSEGAPIEAGRLLVVIE